MFEVFNGMTHQYTRNSYEQLKDFIYRRQEEMFDRGNAARAAIATAAELAAYNRRMRRVFIDGIGGLEETDIPVAGRVIRCSREDGFRMEAIVFQSRPGIWVTGTLYIPGGITAPSAAVLVLCGHSPEGRMDSDYQVVIHTLMRAGLIVFAIDPIGQGERRSFFDPKTGINKVGPCIDDHNMAGVPAVATDRMLQRYFLCDEMRAMDYLLTRPEIDPKRIGVTGSSGGGTQTLAMMAVDDRIAAAAPGTFVTTRRAYMATGGAQDMEQIWPGITEAGFDHVNPLMIFAPRPAAILATSYDFFPIEGARETFETARRFYEMLGSEDHLRLYEDKFTHMYTPALAIRAAEFFSEMLLGEKRTVRNDDVVPFPPEKLQVFPSCNVLDSIPGARTVPDEIRDRAAELRHARTALPPEERLARARRWLAEKMDCQRLPMSFNPRIFPRMHCVQIGGYMGTTMSWWTQKDLFAFGDMIKLNQFDQVDHLPTVIAIWPDGTKKIGDHEAWLRAQCDAGKQVLVLDVPGVGAIGQRPLVIGGQDKAVYGTIFKLACDLMFMGDSLPAMHVWDVLRAIGFLEDEFGIAPEDITLFCEGQDGVWGVMAAFLHERVNVLYGGELPLRVENCICRADPPVYDNTLAYLIPGMLEYFDFYELIRE